MKASELITQLQKLVEEHGDVQIETNKVSRKPFLPREHLCHVGFYESKELGERFIDLQISTDHD